MSTRQTRLFIYLLFMGTAFAAISSVSKSLMVAKESETWNGCWAYLALDDNPKTIAVANASSTIPEFGSTPWWMADMFLYFGVVKVDILSPPHEYFTKTLENFGIYITFYDPLENSNVALFQSCANVTNPAIKPMDLLEYNCPNTLFGRYILIKKFENIFTSELLTLAEVTVYYDIWKKLYSGFLLAT